MPPRSEFQGWLESHRGILVRVARSFARSPADVADLQQELLLQLWLALPKFAGEAKPATWVYRVCLNTALMWRRGAARRESRMTDAEVTSIAPEIASPAERAGERELLQRLYEAIHAMSIPDRTLVLLSLEGLSYRAIGEITGMTENHVGVALTRARKRLAVVMEGVVDEVG